MGIGLRAVTRLLSSIAATALTLGCAQAAHAHNNRAQLAFYGGFGPTASHCQRIISKAAEACAITVVAARNICMSAQIDGQACDSSAVDATALTARQHARDLVQQGCTDDDAKSLQFNGLEEAQADAATACGDAETAVVSATYGPVMVGGSVGSVAVSPACCVRRVLAATRRSATRRAIPRPARATASATLAR